MKRLPLSFFSRHTVDVAKDLIGKILVFGNYQGIIIETEAYRGKDDEASHAFRGITPRSSIMFGRAGISYVYLVYGKYYCLNIVSELDGKPGAVLIRGMNLLEPSLLLDGPGKLCQALGITKQHNGLDLIHHQDFYVAEEQKNLTYKTTPRIGIRSAIDKYWRFVADIP